MRISNELAEAINDQLNFEIYSGYVYLAMKTFLEQKALDGMAHWLEIQFDEEFLHAKIFWKHIIERGGKVTLKQIDEPKNEWESPLEVFKDALHHEELVTSRIYKIGDIADKEGDRAAQSMLNWFYDEQVEEEDKVQAIIDKLELIGDSAQGLIMLDKELGARLPVTPPAILSE